MSATGQRVHDVILRGGRTLRLRPPSEADAEAMLCCRTDLAQASMRWRFHGTRRVDDAMVAAFLDPDWIDEGILLATAVGEDESDRVIGTAGFTRLRDPRAAEVSFVVAEDRQSDWIATRLLERLAGEAGLALGERGVAQVPREDAAM